MVPKAVEILLKIFLALFSNGPEMRQVMPSPYKPLMLGRTVHPNPMVVGGT